MRGAIGVVGLGLAVAVGFAISRCGAESEVTPPPSAAADRTRIGAILTGAADPIHRDLPLGAITRLGDLALVHPCRNYPYGCLEQVGVGPGGRFLFTSGGGRIRFWDAARGDRLNAGIEANQIAFAADGSLVAVVWRSAGSNRNRLVPLELWDPIANTTLRLAHYPEPQLSNLQFVDHTLLYHPGPSQWQRKRTGRGFHELRLPVAARADQTLLVGVDPPRQRIVIRRLDAPAADSDPGCAIEPARRYRYSIALAPDGTTLAFSSNPGVGHLFEISATECRERFRLTWQPSYRDQTYPTQIPAPGLGFTADSRLLVVAAAAGPAQIFDTVTGRAVGELSTGPVVPSIAASPDHRWLVTASEGGRAIVWDDRYLDQRQAWTASHPDSALPALLTQLTPRQIGHRGPITGIQFQTDGAGIITGGEAQVMLWDVAHPAPTRTIDLAVDITGVGALTGDELMVELDYLNGRKPALLDLATGQTRPLSEAIAPPRVGSHLVRWKPAGFAVEDDRGSVFFTSSSRTPAGRVITVARQDQDQRTSRWRRDLAAETAQPYTEFCSAALSHDRRYLALGTTTGRVLLLDATTGDLLADRSGHDDRITALAFSPDGKRLVSGSADTTAVVWDVAALVGAASPSLQ